MARRRLGIFVRVPEPGRVKTRLSPPLSPDDACRLYEAFLDDLFRRLQGLRGTETTVWYAGGDPSRLEPLVPERARLRPQAEGDLGARLAAAFDAMLADDAPAVILGSDSPDVPVRQVRRAVQQLPRHDAARGPACDGGYWLVGLRARAPQLFEGIDWGSDRVLAQTLERIESAGLRLATLPPWYDVDSAEGLRMLRDQVRARRIERRDRLFAVERVLDAIDAHGR